MENRHWCMCTELLEVDRDGFSTCSVCGGRDAYGGSSERPESKRKKIVSEEVTCNGDLNAAHIYRIAAEVRHAWEDIPHASWDINEAGFKAIELFRDILLARLKNNE